MINCCHIFTFVQCMVFNKTQNTGDHFAVFTIQFKRFVSMLWTVSLSKHGSDFFIFNLSVQINDCMMLCKFVTLMNFAASTAIVFPTFQTCHPCLICIFFFVNNFAQRTRNWSSFGVQRLCHFYQIFNEEIFLQALHSFFWNCKFLSTYWTRQDIAWLFVILCL